MKKKISKTLALLLAIMMFATGCGNTANVSKESASDNTSETTSEAASETVVEEVKNYWEMLDEVSDTSDLPDWTGDTLEISVWSAGGTETLFGDISDTNVTFKEFERVTGVKFSPYDCFGNEGDSIDAKLPKVVASKDYPTIIMGWNIDSQMNELYDNGLLADLTEYYENGDLDQLLYWAPLEEMDTLIYSNLRGQDGKLFQIPCIADMSGYWITTGYYPEEYDPTYHASTKSAQDPSGAYSIQSIMIRDDILKALYPDAMSYDEMVAAYMANGNFTEEQIYDLGLNSAEDFYDLLRDIKELLASGEYKGLDGRTMEVTYGPNSEKDNWDWMTTLPRLVKGFAVNTNYFVTADLKATDGNILVNAFSDDRYVEFMRELNTLVNEDVISKNSLVDNSAAYNEKLLNGHYAITYGNNSLSIGSEQNAEWKYRPIWINHGSDMSFGGVGSTATIFSFSIFEDTLTDEQMDQLIHAINYLYSEVGINNFYWGPKSAGLFTEDANGNRTYTDKELEAAMIYNENNSAPVKYGLINGNMEQQTFDTIALGSMGAPWLEPKYLVGPELMMDESRAVDFFNPGILPGKSVMENQLYVALGCSMYSGVGRTIPGNQQFWDARSGFENQMKKTIAAEDFDAELQKLFDYAEDYGLTEETTKAWNELWVETNKVALKGAGLIK